MQQAFASMQRIKIMVRIRLKYVWHSSTVPRVTGSTFTICDDDLRPQLVSHKYFVSKKLYKPKLHNWLKI